MTIRRFLRAILIGTTIIGIVAYAWLAIHVYRTQQAPESSVAAASRWSWILGPPAEALSGAARTRIERGLTRLNDTTVAPAERLRGYHDELLAAESLLERSLRAQPAQARTLATLAAVRWELNPAVTTEGVAQQLEMIRLASRLAPGIPGVQIDLGELLLKMGRPEDAVGYFERAVALDATAAREAVRILRAHLFGAREIFAALPDVPETLEALYDPFFEDEAGAEYLGVVEPHLDRAAPWRLILVYGSACLRLDEAERLENRMTEIIDAGPEEPESAAEALAQRARARARRSGAASALEDAEAARRLRASFFPYAELTGDLLRDTGTADEAVEAYREALSLIAREGQDPAPRARLYTKIGRAQEAAGRADRAYDAYRRALELNPDEGWARRRLEEMKAAAGRLPGSR